MRIADGARNETLGNPALKTADERARYCEHAAIRSSLDNLLTFPWIKERVEQRRLCCHGWYFDIGSGELLRYDPVQGAFLTHMV